MKETNSYTKWVPLLLIVVALLAFGLLIPWLGFYWDDLPLIWSTHFFGPASMLSAFQGDRPIFGFLFMVTTGIFQQNATAWQVFNLLCRWLVALCTFWTLMQVWPKNSFQNILAATFTLLFPGFIEHWISVAYSNIYLVLATAILSIGLMAKAIRTPEKYWLFTFLSMLTAAFNLLSIEYFVGQEFLRPFFIWFILSEKKNQTKRQLFLTIRHWLPTLAVLAVFLGWRIFFFTSNRYSIITPASLHTNFLAYGFGIVKSVVNYFVTGVLYGWGKIFDIANKLDWSSTTNILFWILVLFSAVVIFIVFHYLFLRNTKKSNPERKIENQNLWGTQAMASGFFVSLIVSLPYIMAGLNLSTTFPNDRIAISLMFSGSLLFAGFIVTFISPKRNQILIASVCFGLSIGTQFVLSNTFRRDWDQMKNFWWQIYWRAPAIKAGTMIVSNELPFNFYTDNSLTAPLNWIYASNLKEKEIPFWFAYARLRSQAGQLTFSTATEFSAPYRGVYFKGDITQSLALYLENPGCARFVDEQTIPELLLPQNWDWIKTAASFSDLTAITEKGANEGSMPAIFGSEPTHDWCFFYEKADLARQKQDWNEVSSLANQSALISLKPKNPSEMFPFIEGFLWTNQTEKADGFLNQIIGSIGVDWREEKLQQVCRVLQTMQKKMDAGTQTNLKNWFTGKYQTIGC